MTVKANMRTAPAAEEPSPARRPRRFGVSTDHGRRTVKVVLASAWGRVRRRRPSRADAPHRHQEGKKTVEVVHLITSGRNAGLATLAAWVRSRWEIETKLHWVCDVTYQEDKYVVRTGNATCVMASLRSLAVSLLRLDGHRNVASANRHHTRDPQRTVKLLQAARRDDFARSPGPG